MPRLKTFVFLSAVTVYLMVAATNGADTNREDSINAMEHLPPFVKSTLENIEGLLSSFLPQRVSHENKSSEHLPPFVKSTLANIEGLLSSFMPQHVGHENKSSNVTGHKLPFSFSKQFHQCQQDIEEVGRGLTNIETWALTMLDATGKPGSGMERYNFKFVGNEKECREISHKYSNSFIEGKMCKVVVPILKDPEINLGWDVCLPKSCQAIDLNIGLSVLIKSANLTLHPYAYCTKDFDLSHDTAAISVITILSVFGVLLVLGTLMDIYSKRWSSAHVTKKTLDRKDVINKGFELNETLATDKTHHVLITGRLVDQQNIEIATVCSTDSSKNSSHTISSGSEPNEKQKDITEDMSTSLRVWQKTLLAFSVPHNTKKIMSVKATPGSIGCLHGIRVLSMGWVILGHFIMSLPTIIKNPLDLLQTSKTLAFQLIPNAILSVDTFFVMSGLLTSYVFLKKLGKKGKISVKEFIMYYVHRYWRLTPSMMVWIMIVATLLRYIGDGMTAVVGEFEGKSCRDNWWINMLYINNVYKRKEGCIGVTWFLADDMQFYFIAPLALIPWLYGYRVVGFLINLVFVAVHMASTIWLELTIHGKSDKSLMEQREEKIYYKPYTRIAPFAIGMMLGWVLWKTNCKAKLNKGLVFLGWTLSIGLVLTLTLVTYDNVNHPWSLASRVVERTLFRPLWAMAVSWIIFACATGYGGYVNSILSWEGWLPLSRMTYSAYLIHIELIVLGIYPRDYTIMFNESSASYEFIAFFVIAYAVGFLLTLTVESPMLALEKIVFKKG